MTRHNISCQDCTSGNQLRNWNVHWAGVWEKASLKSQCVSPLTLDQDGKKKNWELKRENGAHCSRTCSSGAQSGHLGKHPERLSFWNRSDQDLWELLTLQMASSRHCVISSGYLGCSTPFLLEGTSVSPSKPSSHLQTTPGHLQKEWFLHTLKFL